MKNWNIFKHTFASLIISLVFNYLWDFITFRKAASIGIIGRADGPTSVFLGSAANYAMLAAVVIVANPGIILFVVLMLLFKPVKRLLNR